MGDKVTDPPMQVMHTPHSTLLHKRGRGGDPTTPLHKRQRTDPTNHSPQRYNSLFSRPMSLRQTYLERPTRSTMTIPRALVPAEYQNRAIVLYQSPENVMKRALAATEPDLSSSSSSSEAMEIDM